MTNELYVLNQVQISASDYNRNGYSQTFLFRDRQEADKHLTKMRSDTLSELGRLKRDFDIYSDSADKFHVAWDSDMEMTIITLKKQTIA
jgi:hypothetical protein